MEGGGFEENPFWSEKARGEARLRVLRPRSLPPLEDVQQTRPGEPRSLGPAPTILADGYGQNFTPASERELVPAAEMGGAIQT